MHTLTYSIETYRLSEKGNGLSTPVFLPITLHGQRNLSGYSPWGPRIRHDWTTKFYWCQDQESSHSPRVVKALFWVPDQPKSTSSAFFPVVSLFKMPHLATSCELWSYGPFKWHTAFTESYGPVGLVSKALLHPTHQIHMWRNIKCREL